MNGCPTVAAIFAHSYCTWNYARGDRPSLYLKLQLVTVQQEGVIYQGEPQSLWQNTYSFNSDLEMSNKANAN